MDIILLDLACVILIEIRHANIRVKYNTVLWGSGAEHFSEPTVGATPVAGTIEARGTDYYEECH